MAAPSSLASSSHLSRRATAAASPSIPPPSPPPPPQRLRCGWVGRAAPPTRRAPGVCSVVSPSKPGVAAVDVPAATIPDAAATGVGVAERISVSSLLEVVADDLLKLNNNLKSVSFTFSSQSLHHSVQLVHDTSMIE
ncbi:Os12g0271700 [Oryza sativa Japonica Group]|uniref:Os12g0271700 protein n=1 Tax=Oryza sativa subsp. japonica TaxID=39947 RepID=A0A0P0Y8X5_ORYSJ|nr:hypothetical protein EE612_058838 [Oryza sativa]BAT16655.1 Os12g0271700 [Oryza sativa Japonica Group]